MKMAHGILSQSLENRMKLKQSQVTHVCLEKMKVRKQQTPAGDRQRLISGISTPDSSWSVEVHNVQQRNYAKNQDACSENQDSPK